MTKAKKKNAVKATTKAPTRAPVAPSKTKAERIREFDAKVKPAAIAAILKGEGYGDVAPSYIANVRSLARARARKGKKYEPARAFERKPPTKSVEAPTVTELVAELVFQFGAESVAASLGQVRAGFAQALATFRANG